MAEEGNGVSVPPSGFGAWLWGSITGGPQIPGAQQVPAPGSPIEVSDMRHLQIPYPSQRLTLAEGSRILVNLFSHSLGEPLQTVMIEMDPNYLVPMELTSPQIEIVKRLLQNGYSPRQVIEVLNSATASASPIGHLENSTQLTSRHRAIEQINYLKQLMDQGEETENSLRQNKNIRTWQGYSVTKAEIRIINEMSKNGFTKAEIKVTLYRSRILLGLSLNSARVRLLKPEFKSKSGKVFWVTAKGLAEIAIPTAIAGGIALVSHADKAYWAMLNQSLSKGIPPEEAIKLAEQTQRGIIARSALIAGGVATAGLGLRALGSYGRTALEEVTEAGSRSPLWARIVGSTRYSGIVKWGGRALGPIISAGEAGKHGWNAYISKTEDKQDGNAGMARAGVTGIVGLVPWAGPLLSEAMGEVFDQYATNPQSVENRARALTFTEKQKSEALAKKLKLLNNMIEQTPLEHRRLPQFIQAEELRRITNIEFANLHLAAAHRGSKALVMILRRKIVETMIAEALKT